MTAKKIVVEINDEPAKQVDAKATICARVDESPEDLSKYGALKGRCAGCGSEIWYSPRSPEGVLKYCYPCAEPLMEGRNVKYLMTSKQVEHLGEIWAKKRSLG